MKSVQLLGSAYKEKVSINRSIKSKQLLGSGMSQVQPDMEELTENAEEGDEEDKQSEQKLGRLNFKVS